MTHDADNENPFGEGRGEAVLSIFKRGAEFTKQLLSENESLRKELREIHERQNEASQCPDQWEQLRQELKSRITTLEEENQQMRDQLTEVESENHHFAERYCTCRVIAVLAFGSSSPSGSLPRLAEPSARRSSNSCSPARTPVNTALPGCVVKPT